MSQAWLHFERLPSGDSAACKKCKSIIKCKGSSTTGLLRHLKLIHKIEEGTLKRSHSDFVSKKKPGVHSLKPGFQSKIPDLAGEGSKEDGSCDGGGPSLASRNEDEEYPEVLDVKMEPVFSEQEVEEEQFVNNAVSSSPHSRQSTPPPPPPLGMAGPYLLKKETHCTSILDELLRDETFTDVTLTAEGRNISAHRIILSLSSKYFKDVLSKDSNTKNVIFFRDVRFEELKNIINFIYTGEVKVDASELESFMRLAELLQVTSLCDSEKHFPKGFPTSRTGRTSEHPVIKSGPKRIRATNSHQSPPRKSRKMNTHQQKAPRKSLPPTTCAVKDEFDLDLQSMEEVTKDEDALNIQDPLEELEGGHSSSNSVSDPGEDKDSEVVAPGRCPFCPPSRQLYDGPTMLTHLQVSRSEKTAYPCDTCYRVFTKISTLLDHNKDCVR